MRAAKKLKKTDLTYMDKKVAVDAPDGYHWMEQGGRYYLMKGDYQPHDGAVKRAQFKLVSHGKS